MAATNDDEIVIDPIPAPDPTEASGTGTTYDPTVGSGGSKGGTTGVTPTKPAPEAPEEEKEETPAQKAARLAAEKAQATAAATAAADKAAKAAQKAIDDKAARDADFDARLNKGLESAGLATKQAMTQAQELAGATQAGVVNTTMGAARAGGLSPAQAALMGAGAGSDTYQQEIGKDFNAINQTAAQRYSTDIQAALGLTGQDLQKYMSDKGNETAEKIAQMGLDAEQTKNIMAGLGFVLQGGAWVLSKFLGFAEGTDSAPGGPVLVGEEGPEIVDVPKGSQILPNADIHDGYGMLEKVLTQIRPTVDKYGPAPAEVPATPDNQIDIDATMDYIRRGGK